MGRAAPPDADPLVVAVQLVAPMTQPAPLLEGEDCLCTECDRWIPLGGPYATRPLDDDVDELLCISCAEVPS